MAIPLGRSLQEPHLLAWQIIHMQSVFFLLLGASATLVQALRFVLFAGSPASGTGSTTGAQQSVHVHLADLFTVTPSLPSLPFWFAHVLAAGWFAVPLSRCVQRRRFVPDFVATCYVVYLVMAWGVGGAFPTQLGWWAAYVSGIVVTFLTSSHLCGKRELMEVELTGSGGSAGATGSNSSGGSVAAVTILSSGGGGGGGAGITSSGTAPSMVLERGGGLQTPTMHSRLGPTSGDDPYRIGEEDALLSGTASKRKPV